MPTVSNDNFGPLVAYLVPGATVLVGLSPFLPAIRTWLAAEPAGSPTIGGFLYLTLAALAAGMTVSAIRWALVDTLHRFTGLPPPRVDFRSLGRSVDAFVLLIDIHYRHYQFYANMLVAVAIAYVGYRIRNGSLSNVGWPDLVFVLLEGIFLATSRDTLQKYYSRTRQLFAVGSKKQR